MQIVFLFLNIIIFCISAIIVVRSSVLLIDNLYKFAKTIKIPTFIVGFFILAIATSVPELLIGITSAIQTEPIISFGNVLGSNLSNFTIIIGIAILVAGPITINKHYRKETIIAFLVSVLFMVLSLDKTISRIDGFVLLTVFIIYAYRLLYEYKQINLKIKHTNSEIKPANTMLYITKISLLILLMMIGSEGIVSSTVEIAKIMGISPLIISLFIVAIGTSLPELSSMIPAIKRNHSGISLGDMLGSIVTNSTLVIGITAIISPITTNNTQETSFVMSFTLVSLLIFYILIKRKSNITQKDSVILIFIYIIFLVVQILLEKQLLLS